MKNNLLQRKEEIKKKIYYYRAVKDELNFQKKGLIKEKEELENLKKIAPQVSNALESFCEKLFEEKLKIIEEKLTIILKEVLGQPLLLKTKREVKRGRLGVSFYIERDGQPEDILKGQGGSVANILSLGLRILALMTVPNRKFLVLDEPDCWLHPSLVHKFVRIIQLTAKELGFQVLLISHHDVTHFDSIADKIYELIPSKEEGVEVKLFSQKSESIENHD